MYCSEEKCFVIKYIDHDSSKIFEFLENSGVNNVIFPRPNLYQNYVSKNTNKFYYITDYFKSNETISEKKATDLFCELTKLHEKTVFPRQLNQNNYRNKFDELSKRLDYLFKKIEEYIRSLENKKIDYNSYQILSNYYIILNAKQELVRLEKKIILSIKDKESINYSFVHNDPKLEHMLYIRGDKYLISLDKGKMGIFSLDYAKFYVENKDLNIDVKTLILNEFNKYETEFYYDYFRFSVLIIYIFRNLFTTDLSTNVNIFLSVTRNIETFMKDFPDKLIKDN